MPGPGEYEPNSNVVKDRQKSFGFGKSQRLNFADKEESLKPGPGSYDLQNLKSAKMVKIGEKLKVQSMPMTPGPGKYDANSNYAKDSIRTFKFPESSKRDFLSASRSECQIGPGQYHTEQNFGQNSPSITLGGKPKQKVSKDIPGPGYYEPRDHLSKERIPTTLIKGHENRHRSASFKSFDDRPGPGQYYQSLDFARNAQKVSIKGKPKEIHRDDIPGPGSYQPMQDLVKESTRNVFMRNDERKTAAQQKSAALPGPGAYDSRYKEFAMDCPTFSIKNGRSEVKQDQKPGPGNYNPSESFVKDKVISYKIGSTSRSSMISKEQVNLPGPGLYDQASTIGRNGPKITMGGRSKSKQQQGIPGPGEYEPILSQVKDKVRSVRISQSPTNKSLTKLTCEMPGPGQYESSTQVGKNCHSFSIRGKNYPKEKVLSPGPGKYDPAIFLTKDGERCTKFSTLGRTDLLSKEAKGIPGPGVYNSSKDFAQDAKKVTIRGRPKDSKQDNHPGPGNYNPTDNQSKERIIAFKIGSSKRAELISKESSPLPGPGAYDNESQIGKNTPKFTISSSAKQQQFTNNQPGPGQYDPQLYLTKNQTPSIKIGGSKSHNLSRDFLSPTKSSMPGPGNYDQQSFIGKGPSVSLRGKPFPNKIDDIPGPGVYSSDQNSIKDKIPAIKIGQSKRDFLSISSDLSNVGPGTYDGNAMKHIVSYSIQGKPKDQQKPQIPGPGTYQVENESAGHHRNPSIDFSKSPDRSRQYSPTNSQIGPGQYDLRDSSSQKFSTICYTIPKGERKEPDDGIPGPGHYKIPVRFADIPSYSMPHQEEQFKYV